MQRRGGRAQAVAVGEGLPQQPAAGVVGRRHGLGDAVDGPGLVGQAAAQVEVVGLGRRIDARRGAGRGGELADVEKAGAGFVGGVCGQLVRPSNLNRALESPSLDFRNQEE